MQVGTIKDIVKKIITMSIDMNDLGTSYRTIYNCTLVCKKWHDIVYRWFVPHLNQYNYQKKQYDFDNTMFLSRLINREYFESTQHTHFKQPNLSIDTKYHFTTPDHYETLLANSVTMRDKKVLLHKKFEKFADKKICKICSVIAQHRTLCGIHLNKIRQKKFERDERERIERERIEKEATDAAEAAEAAVVN